MKICNSFLLYLLFTENWNKKPFYFLELLNIYEKLDFTATSCSEVYIWWRHQKMLMLVKSNYIFKKTYMMVYYITTFCDPSFSQSEVEVGECAILLHSNPKSKFEKLIQIRAKYFWLIWIPVMIVYLNT